MTNIHRNKKNTANAIKRREGVEERRGEGRRKAETVRDRNKEKERERERKRDKRRRGEDIEYMHV